MSLPTQANGALLNPAKTVSFTPSTDFSLLLEDGSFLVLEAGGTLVLE
jgi:hypothetical protein